MSSKSTLVGFLMGCLCLSVSSYAACGGGGFKKPPTPVKPAVSPDNSVAEKQGAKPNDPQSDADKAKAAASTASAAPTTTPVVVGQVVAAETDAERKRRQKLEELMRDVDKAQAKLNNCHGDCENERKKLEKAKNKLAEKLKSST